MWPIWDHRHRQENSGTVAPHLFYSQVCNHKNNCAHRKYKTTALPKAKFTICKARTHRQHAKFRKYSATAHPWQGQVQKVQGYDSPLARSSSESTRLWFTLGKSKFRKYKAAVHPWQVQVQIVQGYSSPMANSSSESTRLQFTHGKFKFRKYKATVHLWQVQKVQGNSSPLARSSSESTRLQVWLTIGKVKFQTALPATPWNSARQQLTVGKAELWNVNQFVGVLSPVNH